MPIIVVRSRPSRLPSSTCDTERFPIAMRPRSRGNPDSRFFALPRTVHAAAADTSAAAREDDAIDLIHVDDAARALLDLGTQPDSSGVHRQRPSDEQP